MALISFLYGDAGLGHAAIMAAPERRHAGSIKTERASRGPFSGCCLACAGNHLDKSLIRHGIPRRSPPKDALGEAFAPALRFPAIALAC